MVSKTLKKKTPARPAKNTTTAPVVNSAKDILFAGLGVFSVAQKEGEKLVGQGTKLFDRLVSEGARFEKKSIHSAETAVKDIRTDVEKRFKGVTRQVNENWDSLGNVFDGRVSVALERLGIPTSKELEKLSGHVKDMSAKAANSWKGLEKVARDAADNLGKLEKEFTKRVELALGKLHVPRLDDLNKLESQVEKRISSVFGKLEATTNEEIRKLNANVKDVSSQVSADISKFEGLVEERVKKVIGSLGLPARRDFDKLGAELNKLAATVADLEKKLAKDVKTPQSKPASPSETKAKGGMTAAERKKAAEAISKMKPASKPGTTDG